MKKSLSHLLSGKALTACICASLVLALLPTKGFSENGKSPSFETAKELFSQGYIFFNKMNYLAAAEYFRKALSAYPDYYTAREYLARSYRLAGYNDEAVTEWELLYKDSDSPSVKSKIDALRFRDYPAKGSVCSEYVFSRKLESNELGRHAFPYPSSLALDSEKNLFVTSFTQGRIVKFDSAGEPDTEKSFSGAKIYGLDASGDLLIASDFAHDKILILDSDLSLKKEIGSTGDTAGKFHGPEGLKFDKKGYFYVVDSGNARIQKFASDGTFILSFGKNGIYEGDLANPTDCAISDGSVYITDSGNKRIAVFDDSGNFKENFKIDGLLNPKGICIKDRTLVISDEKSGLCFYNMDDKTSVWFKTWNDGNDSFSRVHAAAYDRDGFLYTLDHGKQSVFVFTPLSARFTNLDVEISSIDIAKYPLVAFYLNIRDRSGRPVYGLKPSQLEVSEDSAGIRSFTLDYLKSQAPSVSASIILDRSIQSKPYHTKMVWASDFFLKKMLRNDTVKIVNVNADEWTGNNFDWSRLRSLKAIQETTFGQGKKAGKALYNAIGELAPKLNRRAVIFMTDGSVDQSTFSPYTARQIIQYAQAHFVQVYIVSFGEADPAFKTIADATGGAVLHASDADTLGNLYSRIKGAEEYRYVLVYKSFKTEEFALWWSDVSIKVSLNGVSGVEWGGYFVPLPKGIKNKPSNLRLPGEGRRGGGEGAPAAAAPAAGGGGHGE